MLACGRRNWNSAVPADQVRDHRGGGDRLSPGQPRFGQGATLRRDRGHVALHLRV